MSSPKPRLRERQAAATRLQIVAAARRLFAEHGFAETSIAQIAAEAGVAVQTVYKSMGSKRALLMALIDSLDVEADVPARARALRDADEPAALIHGVVELTRAFPERCGDILRALDSAAAGDPDAAAALAEGEHRHRVGAASVAKRLEEMGALREGMSADDAGTLISVLTARHGFTELADGRGWSFDRAARWIEGQLSASLLRG